MKAILARLSSITRRLLIRPIVRFSVVILVLCWTEVYAAWAYGHGDHFQVAALFLSMGVQVASLLFMGMTEFYRWRQRRQDMIDHELRWMMMSDAMRWEAEEHGDDTI